MRLLLFAAVTACTGSTLNVTGDPITCDTLGGQVDGTIVDPFGATTSFGPVQASLETDHVVLDDGKLQLAIGVGTPPRTLSLAFPERTVFAITARVVIDQDLACYAGRFNIEFQYHGDLTGWFAVP